MPTGVLNVKLSFTLTILYELSLKTTLLSTTTEALDLSELTYWISALILEIVFMSLDSLFVEFSIVIPSLLVPVKIMSSTLVLVFLVKSNDLIKLMANDFSLSIAFFVPYLKKNLSKVEN